MIQAILPASTEVRFTHNLDTAVTLMGDEAQAVDGAIEKRRREFSTTRRCAREVLIALGQTPRPLSRGPHGEPLWPDGITGSITHCDGYYAAAAATKTPKIRSLGIDAEPNLALPPNLIQIISDVEERSHMPSDKTVAFDRLLFSAKEATYKAQFPLTGLMLEFDQVKVSFTSFGRFTATIIADGLTVPHPLGLLRGRWIVERGFIGAAVAI